MSHCNPSPETSLEDEKVAQARALREEGKTLQEIADELGYKDRSTVCKMLKRVENVEC